MKNLFSINKTTDRDAAEFDATPYTAAHVSDGVRDKLKSAFSVLEEETAPRKVSPEEAALRKQSNRYWLICIGCFALALLLFFGGEQIGLYSAVPALHVLDLALLVCAIVFNFKARKVSRKQSALDSSRLNLDFTEASKRLEEAAAEAARELGVPAGALSVDVLPYHYKVSDGAQVPVGKKGRFDNVSVSAFVEGDALCLATAHELLRIPRAHISGYRTYDEEYEIDMWLKPEEFDSERYKEFGIRKSGFLARRLRGYYGIVIEGEEAFELRIPCYDFSPVRELLSLQPLA